MKSSLPRPSFLPRLLLTLAFLVGQCLALAHATQHELAAGDSPTCETCAIAHAAGAAPAALSWVCPPPPTVEIADASRPHNPFLRPTRRLRSRAPPASLS